MDGVTGFVRIYTETQMHATMASGVLSDYRTQGSDTNQKDKNAINDIWEPWL